MSAKTYIGLDPGKQGGMVAITPETVIAAPTPCLGDEISQAGIVGWLTSRIAETGRENMLVGIEDVHSIYGTAAGSNFEFGRALGILEGIVSALGIPTVKVQPKVWQRVAFLGIPPMTKTETKKGVTKTKRDTKSMAALAAERLYPHADLLATEKSTKPHEGIVDALLIAHYLKVQNL